MFRGTHVMVYSLHLIALAHQHIGTMSHGSQASDSDPCNGAINAGQLYTLIRQHEYEKIIG